MAQQIDESTAELWRKIAGKLSEAKKALDDAELILMLELDCTDNKPVSAIRGALESVNGLAYLFTPQTVWQGGDSLNPANHKQTLPHIMR